MALYTVNGSTCNIAVWIQVVSMLVIDRIVVHGSGCGIAVTKSTISFAIRIRMFHFNLVIKLRNMSMALTSCSSECANRSSRN